MPKLAKKSTMSKTKVSKKSNKRIGKKIHSKKSKKSVKGKKIQTKRVAPAALLKVMTVSQALSDIIGVKKASRPQAIKGLWAYIKLHNLQDKDQKQMFVPDEKMAKVFGKNKMKAIHMSKYLSAHLSD